MRYDIYRISYRYYVRPKDATNIALQTLWPPQSHYRLKKIRSTFSENRNGIFTSDIEIRMPTTETDDKRIQIFTDDCSKDRDCKLDILSFAVRNFKSRALFQHPLFHPHLVGRNTLTFTYLVRRINPQIWTQLCDQETCFQRLISSKRSKESGQHKFLRRPLRNLTPKYTIRFRVFLLCFDAIMVTRWSTFEKR